MKLSNFGFVEVGEWVTDKNSSCGINFKLNRYEDDRVLYAFVVEGEVKYVGICKSDSTTLKKRMKRYIQNRTLSNSTNTRIIEKIKECLEKKGKVKIFGLKPILPLTYQDLGIDLVAGLEIPLIKELNSPWNTRKE